jgi:hypothetical protein
MQSLQLQSDPGVDRHLYFFPVKGCWPQPSSGRPPPGQPSVAACSFYWQLPTIAGVLSSPSVS